RSTWTPSTVSYRRVHAALPSASPSRRRRGEGAHAGAARAPPPHGEGARAHGRAGALRRRLGALGQVRYPPAFGEGGVVMVMDMKFVSWRVWSRLDAVVG